MMGQALLINAEDNKVLLDRFDPRKSEITEEFIQNIIYEYPQILPLNEISSMYKSVHAIGKEFPVKSGSIDVVLMSSQGNPIIVETKLWKNPEAKREVIAQVMDYFLCFKEMSYDEIDNEVKNRFPDKGIYELLKNMHLEKDDFIRNVNHNLETGRILAVIVTDCIREELISMIERINKYLHIGAELCLIEIQLFKIDKNRNMPLLFIPRIYAKTKIIQRSVIEIKGTNFKVDTINIRQETAPTDDVKPKQWSYDELVEVYTNFQNTLYAKDVERADLVGKRILKILKK